MLIGEALKLYLMLLVDSLLDARKCPVSLKFAILDTLTQLRANKLFAEIFMGRPYIILWSAGTQAEPIDTHRGGCGLKCDLLICFAPCCDFKRVLLRMSSSSLRVGHTLGFRIISMGKSWERPEILCEAHRLRRVYEKRIHFQRSAGLLF